MNTGTKISIIVPTYRAELTLATLYHRLVRVFETMGHDFEIIFVEDCGGDGSWDIIRSLAEKDARVGGLRLARNYGQHNALLCGIRHAKGNVIVTIDDDLQNPPEEIPHLLQKLDEGFDVVYGVPKKETHGLFRNLASKMTKLTLGSVMGSKTAAQISSFRAFHGSLRKAFDNYRGSTASIDVLLTWGAARYTAVRVRQNMREGGTSGYSFRKLIHHAFNLITGMTTLPLQMASLLGFVFSVFGVVILAYVLIRYMVEGSTVPGFPFLASIIAIFSGAQLFALGIIGEYLARIHLSSMGIPAYVVSETVHAGGGRTGVHQEPS